MILKEHDEFFRYVPIESLIEKNQQAYYDSLEKCDKSGESTLFVEFMLGIIKSSLEEMSSEIIGVTNSFEDRMERGRGHFASELFSRKDYMELFKTVSSATASRDLKDGVEQKYLKKNGSKNQTRYQFR